MLNREYRESELEVGRFVFRIFDFYSLSSKEEDGFVSVMAIDEVYPDDSWYLADVFENHVVVAGTCPVEFTVSIKEN
jgi:hypothetical protein